MLAAARWMALPNGAGAFWFENGRFQRGEEAVSIQSSPSASPVEIVIGNDPPPDKALRELEQLALLPAESGNVDHQRFQSEQSCSPKYFLAGPILSAGTVVR